VLELVGHSGLQGDDLAFALDELLREIDVAPADRDGRRSSALYMAEVALHVCTGAPLDDDLRAALPVLGPYLEIWASHALAETLAVVGKADQADKVERLGV